MMKIKNAVIASVFVVACAGIAFCAYPPLDGLVTPPQIVSSTVTGKAFRSVSGKFGVAASSATAGTHTIILDGTTGIWTDKNTRLSSLTMTGPLTLSGSSLTVTADALFNSDLSLAASRTLNLSGAGTEGAYGLQFKAEAPYYPLRFIGASDSGMQRYFEFGYFNSDSVAGTWNRRAHINSYTGDILSSGTLTVQGNAFSVGGSTFSCNNGMCGIGVALSTAMFQVNGTGSTPQTQPSVYIGQSNTIGSRWTSDWATGAVYFDNAYNNVAGDIYFRTKTSGAPTTALFIESAGNVGIGTTGPTSKLEVNGGLAASSATISGELGLKTYKETISSVTVNADNYNVGWSSSSIYWLALSSSTTLTFSGAKAGQTLTLFIQQDVTGSRLITWPTICWPGGAERCGGIAPTLTATANRFDVITIFYNGSEYIGFVGGQNY